MFFFLPYLISPGNKDLPQNWRSFSLSFRSKIQKTGKFLLFPHLPVFVTDSTYEFIYDAVFMLMKKYFLEKCWLPQPSDGDGNGTPLQYSCLVNPMDGGAWKAAVHGVAEGRTWLSDFTFTFHFHALEKEMATHSSVLAWRIPGWGSLVGCRLWGHTESDTAEVT